MTGAPSGAKNRFRVFGIRRLADDAERANARDLVLGFDETDGIESRFFFWFGAAMLVLFIAVIASASVLPVIVDLEMGFVAMAFGLIMLVRYRAIADRFYQAIDWDLLAFFAFLFVVINVMEHTQVLALIGRGLAGIIGLGDLWGSAAILVSSAAASSVTDNIPLAAMLAKILAQHPDIGGDPSSPFWWAVIFGANLGGNLTPIGSASTLVAVTVMHKHGVPLSFAGFVAKALPYALVHLFIATLYVLIVVPFLA